VSYKQYLYDESGNKRQAKPFSVIDDIYTQHGTAEVRELFDDQVVIQFPKPVDLIKMMLHMTTDPAEHHIVFDFFAGSCATAQASIELNLEDSGNREFVMIQLPELTSEESAAHSMGLETIAEIGKERIRRVLKRIKTADEAQEDSPQLALDLDNSESTQLSESHLDLGFKVFKLAPSTFRRWESPAEAEDLEQQLSYFDEGLKDGADRQHVIYEVLLKEGYSLNSQIELLALPSNTVYRITDEVVERPEDEEADQEAPQGPPPSFYLCLDEAIAIETVDALPLDDQTTFICLDNALNDAQKVNLALQCVLKTV
jgi:adenine-specific DNA-methyltransferase